MKYCVKCSTDVHVGIATKPHTQEMMYICLSCLYDKKEKLYLQYTCWSVVDDQRYKSNK